MAGDEQNAKLLLPNRKGIPPKTAQSDSITCR
jgi:hypothetical protein